MKQMTWDDYYGSFCDWSPSTQKNYTYRLSDYGPAMSYGRWRRSWPSKMKPFPQSFWKRRWPPVSALRRSRCWKCGGHGGGVCPE